MKLDSSVSYSKELRSKVVASAIASLRSMELNQVEVFHVKHLEKSLPVPGHFLLNMTRRDAHPVFHVKHCSKVFFELLTRPSIRVFHVKHLTEPTASIVFHVKHLGEGPVLTRNVSSILRPTEARLKCSTWNT